MNKQISRMNKIFTSLVFLSTSKTDGSNESSGPLIRLESVGIFVSECSSVYEILLFTKAHDFIMGAAMLEYCKT